MRGKSGPTSRFSRSDLLRAARRHYDLGETQAVIAKDMGISPSYLTRLLARAKEDGTVRIYVDVDRETELAAEIQKKYPQLVHVEVVRGGHPRPEDTARDLATAAARWFDDIIDRDLVDGNPQIRNIAVGGSMMMLEFFSQVARRQNRLSVGPTALTPSPGKHDRVTPYAMAILLGERLGAIVPGSSAPPAASRTGYVYGACPDIDDSSLPACRASLARWEHSTAGLQLANFWGSVDIAFVAVSTLHQRYQGLDDRLARLGTSIEQMHDRGAVVLCANRFLDEAGNDVPIAEGMTAYEPAIPTEVLRSAESKAARSMRFTVIEAWGKTAPALPCVLRGGIGNVLLCDVMAATALLHST